MFTVMIFLFFFFVGLLAAMWYHASRLLGQVNELSEEHAQLRVLLRALEARLDGISALEKISAPEAPDPKRQQSKETDPLLHLSFDKNPELPKQILDGNDPLKM